MKLLLWLLIFRNQLPNMGEKGQDQVSSNTARERYQALSLALSSISPRSEPPHITLDKAVKEGALWVLTLMSGEKEQVEKWHFLNWKGGRILLHLGCSECRKDIFEEVSI